MVKQKMEIVGSDINACILKFNHGEYTLEWVDEIHSLTQGSINSYYVDDVPYEEIKLLHKSAFIEYLKFSFYEEFYLKEKVFFSISCEEGLLLVSCFLSYDWKEWSEEIDLRDYAKLLSLRLQEEMKCRDMDVYIEESQQNISFAVECEGDETVEVYIKILASTLQKNTTELINSYKREDTKNTTNRCIEFEPQYYKAGLSILNYFGTVVREKYPEGNAKVKIEQDGYSVRMTVETDGGDKEIIEKLLEDYELVVIGEKPPEELFDSKLQILDLKHELMSAQVQIETQKNFIEYQNNEHMDLKSMFKKLLGKDDSRVININMNQSVEVSITNDICTIVNDLQKINDTCSDKILKTYFESVKKEAENLEEIKDKKEMKASSGLKKIKELIEDADEVGSSLNRFFKTTAKGIENLKVIAKKYNNIAQWCGAPQIPLN